MQNRHRAPGIDGRIPCSLGRRAGRAPGGAGRSRGQHRPVLLSAELRYRRELLAREERTLAEILPLLPFADEVLAPLEIRHFSRPAPTCPVRLRPRPQPIEYERPARRVRVRVLSVVSRIFLSPWVYSVATESPSLPYSPISSWAPPATPKSKALAL